MSTGVLIVGASAAGLSVAENLRHSGYTDSIHLLGAEPHIPYDRPPLSKQMLSGTWSDDKVRLRDAESLSALGIELKLGRRATSLDIVGHTVEVEGNERLSYKTLVLATGLRPRIPAEWAAIEGVHTLHTLDDCMRLRKAIASATEVVVIGAGVLGCEIAATSRSLGTTVSLLDLAPTPMHRQLGTELGSAVAELHRRNDVNVLNGSAVSGFVLKDGRIAAVETTDRVLATDLVLVAMGGTPETEWLADSGLIIDDGVVCDPFCKAADDVFAAGDVARWYHRGLGRSIRLENRTNATEQGMAVAANIMGQRHPYTPIPYFWTDQYDVKIQVFGSVEGNPVIHFLDGNPSKGRFVAQSTSDATPTAVVGWNHPRGVRNSRPQILDYFQGRAVSSVGS